MPLLGGLFNKRTSAQKHPQNGPSNASESVASSASNADSTDGDYVLPDKSLPPPPSIYLLPSSASSSRLKLPFRRKPIPGRPPLNDPSTSLSAVSLNDGPSSYISSVTSDSGHALPPPPRRSSIFGVYSDSFPSIHSFPNDSSSRVHSDTPARLSSSDCRAGSSFSLVAQGHQKSPGLFAWARDRTKSRPAQPSPIVPSTVPSFEDPSSFNLKSFRHIRADSSATSLEKSPQPQNDPLLVPPRPRPRGDSVASDSSQRISVAAFREAQARSRANSPAPSFRPSSAADTLRVDVTGRKRASTVSVISPIDPPQSAKSVSPAPLPSLQADPSALDTSSDDSDSEEDDEDVDSDGQPIPKPAQNRMVTRRVIGTRARSDTGHGSVPASDSKVSHSRLDLPELSKPVLPLMYQSDQTSAPIVRPRASISTSAMTPNGAACRAANLASTSSSHGHTRHSPRKSTDSEESVDSLDSDSEDMPLRDLVAPRRPGSAASNYSSSRPRMPVKPLIDIKSLAGGGGPPLLTPILRHENSIKNLNGKEQDAEKDQPFSIPAALAFSSSTSTPVSPPASKQDPIPVDRPASTAQNRRSSSDVPSPPKPKGPDNDDDLINAIQLVGALDKETEPSANLKPPAKGAPDRIVPTPIREREPPTSFTVLSRPAQRQSTTETSASLSPASQSQFTPAPCEVSPPSDMGARQSMPTKMDPPVQNDKSDTLSISSTTRSTSRSSSRIPPVPLIHSVPDSPSVREEYKADRSHTASHGSAAVASDARSQPSSATLTSGLTLAQGRMLSHGLQPHRPFVSKTSVRTESPAGSSTGDSSSGRAPFTPRDGSDIGARSKEDTSDLGSTLKARGHAKKLSVTFEDSQAARGQRAKTELTGEQRTRERRRSEAKAAIELGKIVNSRGLLVHDDSDEDMRLRGRNPAINVTADNGVHGMIPPTWGVWQQPMGTGTSMNPMVQPQFNNDPAFLAAHQRALLFAKQAYQMAVAQHAMQLAGEEWERGSTIGLGTGGSVYGGGGGSVYGGGSGGSVYGGGSGGSVYGSMGGSVGPMGMMSVPNVGMLMPPQAPWARSSIAFPGSSGSVYGGGISNSQSEYGGPGGWGTQSVYGEPFRPSSSHGNFGGRAHGHGQHVTGSGASAYGGGVRPRASTGASSPTSPTGFSSTHAGARGPGKSAARGRAPPSSWKSGR